MNQRRSLRQIVSFLSVCSVRSFRFSANSKRHRDLHNVRHHRFLPKTTLAREDSEIDTEGSEDNSITDTAKPVWCPEKQIYMGGVIPDNADVDALIEENNGFLRIFGYGSLCWNPGQDAVLSKPGVQASLGRAKGFKRCWSQRSADHRGTPSFSGIVCTLLTDDEVQTIRNQDGNQQHADDDEVSATRNSNYDKPSMAEGVIYTIPPELVDACLSELDFREKGGYERDMIEVIEDDTGETVKALLYRGTPENPAFWKRALLDLPFAAATMAVAIGPSGRNDEYLFNLDTFMSEAALSSKQAAAALDDHIGDYATVSLASMARNLQKHPLFFLFGSGSNQHGQLLLPTKDNRASLINGDEAHETKEIVFCAPEGLSTTDKTKHLYAGGGHSGLLTESGKLYLWGWNDHGQLGRKSGIEMDEKDSAPLPIVTPLDIVVASVALGHSHTVVIEEESGRLYSFGDNERGQVDGTNGGYIVSPMTPVGLEDYRFVDVSAGLFHTAGITSDGELLTFGCSRFGQSLKANIRDNDSSSCIRKWKPKDGSRLMQVSCGRRHTVVLDEYGRLWTFGENKYGQLGRDVKGSLKGGTRKSKWDSTPRLVDGMFGVKKEIGRKISSYRVDCGWSHSVVIFDKEDGCTEVYGWGRNDKGQLGTGSFTNVMEPTAVFDSLPKRIASVSCGSESTMVLDESGTLLGCGWNEHGNLSVGTVNDSHTLKKIVGARISRPPTSMSDSSCDSSDIGSGIVMAAGGAHFLATKK